MAEAFNVPTFREVIHLLLPVPITWEGESLKVDDWRREYLEDVKETRQQRNKIRTFNIFVSALLQGYRTKGGYFGARIERMDDSFADFAQITEPLIWKLLKKEGYSLMGRGIGIVLAAKEIVAPSSFVWEPYFREAEQEYESGYEKDVFLGIHGVGRKVRDFALKQFSNHWCAVDRHVADVLQRTGLYKQGYGDPGFGTDPTNERNYLFMQRLLIRFSKELGWLPGSAGGYSPGEIDSMFWFFGQGICKGDPECDFCPLTDICFHFNGGG